MRALCAVRVSAVSLGMANESIWPLSAPSFVCCSTVTLVIRVPARVTWTCMGPYGVLATVPVTVRVDIGVGVGVGVGAPALVMPAAEPVGVTVGVAPAP